MDDNGEGKDHAGLLTVFFLVGSVTSTVVVSLISAVPFCAAAFAEPFIRAVRHVAGVGAAAAAVVKAEGM